VTIGPGLAYSGSIGAGWSLDFTDWLDSRPFIQGQFAVMGAVGEFTGVGTQVQVGTGTIGGGLSNVVVTEHVEYSFGVSGPGIPGPSFTGVYDSADGNASVGGAATFRGGGRWGWGAGNAGGYGRNFSRSYGFPTIRELIDQELYWNRLEGLAPGPGCAP
jgi:hypothetical protein